MATALGRGPWRTQSHSGREWRRAPWAGGGRGARFPRGQSPSLHNSFSEFCGSFWRINLRVSQGPRHKLYERGGFRTNTRGTDPGRSDRQGRQEQGSRGRGGEGPAEAEADLCLDHAAPSPEAQTMSAAGASLG